MKVCLWAMGAPSEEWVMRGEDIYRKRISHYLPFEYRCIQATKSRLPEQALADEARWLLKQFETTPSKVILLDEKGPQLTSIQFSRRLESWRQGSHRQLVFVIGSAYGFADEVRDRADKKLGLSTMTLPHQLCRLLMLEQLYRACTIWKGESYHHE